MHSILYTDSKFTVPVRLRDGNISSDYNTALDGRLEVLKGGVWGTVCDPYFSVQDGAVVCRQLGFYGAMETFNFAHFPMASNNTPITLSNVFCDGTEVQFSDCSGVLDSQSTAYCSHQSDVGVVCLGKMTKIMLNIFFCTQGQSIIFQECHDMS